MLHCASPLGASGFEGHGSLRKDFARYGGVLETKAARIASNTVNRTFFALGPSRAILHPCIDPLVGFHFPAVHAPASHGKPEKQELDRATNSVKCLRMAQVQFREWILSFRKAASSHATLRFAAADAICFSHTLQAANDEQYSLTAHLKVHGSTFETLMLSPQEYRTDGSAPTKFDVIDTSDLFEYIGALSVLIATAPLLRDSIAATLYTGIVIKYDADATMRMSTMLRGSLSSVGMILGLMMVDAHTNATVVCDIDETTPALLLGQRADPNRRQKGDLRTRLSWKPSSSLQPSRPRMQVSALAKVLHGICRELFPLEDLTDIMKRADYAFIRKSAFPVYTRLSFVALLCVATTNKEGPSEVAQDCVRCSGQRKATVAGPSGSHRQKLHGIPLCERLELCEDGRLYTES